MSVQLQPAQEEGCKWFGCSELGTPQCVGRVLKEEIIAFNFKLIVCIFHISIPWSD